MPLRGAKSASGLGHFGLGFLHRNFVCLGLLGIGVTLWLNQASLTVLSFSREGHRDAQAHTIAKSRQTGSEGCAPTPSQYFARDVSSLMSLNGLPSPKGGGFGIGSYVPNNVLEERTVLVDQVLTNDFHRLAVSCAPGPNQLGMMNASRKGQPGLSYDNVVERSISFAKASEPDSNDHLPGLP